MGGRGASGGGAVFGPFPGGGAREGDAVAAEALTNVTRDELQVEGLPGLPGASAAVESPGAADVGATVARLELCVFAPPRRETCRAGRTSVAMASFASRAAATWHVACARCGVAMRVQTEAVAKPTFG